MAVTEIREIPILGMDCAECTMHVQRAIAALPGVQSVDVLLGAEKAIIQLDPNLVSYFQTHDPPGERAYG